MGAATLLFSGLAVLYFRQKERRMLARPALEGVQV